jgi:hypothetical protein
MKLLHLIFCLMVTLGLAACDGTEAPRHYYYSGPELQGFHMYDSFDVDSELEPFTQLALDPYEYDGWFDLFWYVDSYWDYTVVVGVNDRPSMNGATVVAANFCGEDLPCDALGTYQCRYTDEFYIGCGFSEIEARANLTSISHLLNPSRELPQRVYFVLEVCDTDGAGCEYQPLPVWLY